MNKSEAIGTIINITPLCCVVYLLPIPIAGKAQLEFLETNNIPGICTAITAVQKPPIFQ